MVARGVVAVAALAFGAWAGADEPKKADDPKAGVVGKWQTDDKDKVPLEINADGTIKVPFIVRDGKWVMAEGTYTVSDAGQVRYRATSGEVTLGGWYEYKNGALVSAMGPKNRVTWKKVEEKKQ